MSSNTTEFHIGTVLSITHDRFLSPDGVGALYGILNWMTGDDLFTHQLPRAARECKPFLLAQYPQLSSVIVPQMSTVEELDNFLATLYNEHGITKSVAPIPTGSHARISPLTELKMLRPDVPVILVEAAK